MIQKKPCVISVFVPVYNGANYLEQTLLSIQKQTFKDFEVLMVDDGSTDGSMNILKQFAAHDNRFKLFTKPNGGTVTASLNYILPHVYGEFIFYSSQDDLFSVDLLQKMTNRQHETLAEIIVPEMVFYEKQISNPKKISGYNGDLKPIISGRLAFEASIDWQIHGFALVRKSLFDNEIFPTDAFDSDEFVSRKLFLKSQTVAFSQGTFYYRQDNPNAITKGFTFKNFYSLNTHWHLYDLAISENLETEIATKLFENFVTNYLEFKIKYESYKFEIQRDKSEIFIFLNEIKFEKIINHDYFFKIKEAFFQKKYKFLFKLLACRYVLFYVVFKVIKRR